MEGGKGALHPSGEGAGYSTSAPGHPSLVGISSAPPGALPNLPRVKGTLSELSTGIGAVDFSTVERSRLMGTFLPEG